MNKMPLICYESYGDATHPCIILISGIGSQLIHWPEKFIQGLTEKGFYVVAFDNRDTGLSAHYDHLVTPNLTEVINARQQGNSFQPPYTLEDMAVDVIGLMEQLQIEQAHLLGISMGGMIAQLVAVEYPDRILSLICIATTSGDPGLPPAQPEVLNYLLSPKRQAEDLESYISDKIHLYKIYNHPEHWDEIKAQELYRKSYHRAHKPSGFFRQLLAIICSEPRTKKLAQLQLPCLIIHGDYDPVFPVEHGQQLAKCLLNSQLVIIKKMGHGLPEHYCDKIISLIETFIINSVQDAAILYHTNAF